jgi:hypothetical protein
MTPNGNLQLCYDERGASYSVPPYAYSDPSELITGSSSSNTSNSTLTKEKSAKGMSSSTPTSARGTPIKIKVRINPGDYNIILDVVSGTTIQDLKKIISNYAAEVGSLLLSLRPSDPSPDHLLSNSLMGRCLLVKRLSSGLCSWVKNYKTSRR